MTPLELKEEKNQIKKDLRALKDLCGGLVLETHGPVNPNDLTYYIRKFNEAQTILKRIK